MKTYTEFMTEVELSGDEDKTTEELVDGFEKEFMKAFPKGWFKKSTGSLLGTKRRTAFSFGIVPEKELHNKSGFNDPAHHSFMLSKDEDGKFELKNNIGGVMLNPADGSRKPKDTVETKFRNTAGDSKKVEKAFKAFIPRFKKIVTDNASDIYRGDTYTKGTFK
jgi:hypothetical protein